MTAMIFGNRLARSLAFALVAASATLAASTSNAAAPRYDGLCSVSIVTETGDCDRGYRYPIRISHGTLVNGGSDPFTISGRVAPVVAITVIVSRGDQRAIGYGRRAGNEGEGHWSGGSCAGTWSAEERSS